MASAKANGSDGLNSAAYIGFVFQRICSASLETPNKKYILFGISDILNFGRMETVDMDIWKFLIFRHFFQIWNLRPNFPSGGHIWTVRSIYSSKKSIYGPYGPYISGRKSIYGPSVHIFLVGSPYIAVLWVSELILWVSELIPLYFGCLNLYFGCLNL